MEFELIKEAEEVLETKSEKPSEVINNVITPPVNTEIKIDQKSETRGRHKKDCNCEKCLEKKGGVNTEKKPKEPKEQTPPNPNAGTTANVGEDEFLKMVGNYESATPQSTAGTQPQPQPTATVLISGYVFLLCLDAVIPSLCLKVFKMINKKAADIDVKAIKLTKDQIKALEPIADQAAKLIFEQMHPVPALILGMGFMYMGNIMTELD